jgi:uncharacterized protein (TIGR03118 family)
VSALYGGDVNGTALGKNPLTVMIPGGAPTAVVFNGTNDFVISAGNASGPAIFLFASETGHISGWNPGVPLPPPARVAQPIISTPGAAFYTGLAIGSNRMGNFLFAADFRNGAIAVFDRTFAPRTLAGSLDDPGIPENFAPFNIQNLGGKLYVTYARQDDDGAGRIPDRGAGFVSVFDTDGHWLYRLASRNPLRAPWGLALAPADFGRFSNALLVGNHGDGRIHAFHPTTGQLLGQLRDERGRPIAIDGLWGLSFGNGVTAGDRNTLYFAAAPKDGQDGLFGSLGVVPDTPPSRARDQEARPEGGEDGPSRALAVAVFGVWAARTETGNAGEDKADGSPGTKWRDRLPEKVVSGTASSLAFSSTQRAGLATAEAPEPNPRDTLFASDLLFEDPWIRRGGRALD